METAKEKWCKLNNKSRMNRYMSFEIETFIIFVVHGTE